MKKLSSPEALKTFESIKKIDADGIEYWEARELMPLLEYPNWAKAEELLTRAKKACVNSGQDVENHFHQTVKMVHIGSNTVRKIRDYQLDRYALAIGMFRVARSFQGNIFRTSVVNI